MPGLFYIYGRTDGCKRGYARDRDERRRERTTGHEPRVALMKWQQLKEQAEAYCHYDTQNTNQEQTSSNLKSRARLTTNTKLHIYNHIKGMSERNSQTPSTRQTPFEARLKKALRLSSVPC